MKNIAPNGITIPESTNYLSNFTRILRVTEKLESDYTEIPNPNTPGINTTLSGGRLSNINDPILDSQAATYAYAISQAGSANPGGPIQSIQFNNGGLFDGSATLTFDNTTNTLSANKISNGVITIESNTITGLDEPVLDQDAATKNYVDNINNIKIIDNNTIGSSVYTASSVINSVILRNNQTSAKVTDTLPNAVDIINESNAQVGTLINFSIRNTSSDYNSVITFNVGTGFSPITLQNIYAGYQYNGAMLVTNVSPGLETIVLYNLSNTITNTTAFATEFSTLATVVDVINVKDFMLDANIPTEITSFEAITTDLVSQKIILMNPSTPVTVYLEDPINFSGSLGIFVDFKNPFIWTTGGLDFYIINESSTLGATITIGTTVLPDVSWTLDANSNMTIPEGHTGWFMIKMVVTDFPAPNSLVSANIYCLGIFPNS